MRLIISKELSFQSKKKVLKDVQGIYGQFVHLKLRGISFTFFLFFLFQKVINERNYLKRAFNYLIVLTDQFNLDFDTSLH